VHDMLMEGAAIVDGRGIPESRQSGCQGRIVSARYALIEEAADLQRVSRCAALAEAIPSA